MSAISSGFTEDEHYTLLGVRPDGVAPVVDLVEAMGLVRAKALALLNEHASCETVEVWRSGLLVERPARAQDTAV